MSEPNYQIAVRALEQIARAHQTSRGPHGVCCCATCNIAKTALHQIESEGCGNDPARSELADTKRLLESCQSLLGHACGTSPSPTWPYVLEFARRMEKKLDANRHKGNREGWINDDPASLIRRIQGETDELIGAIHKGQNAQRIADEAADIANFCMMAADWFLAREEPPKNQP